MTILGTTTAEADARLIRTENQPQDAGFKLFRGWSWLAGYSVALTDNVADLIVALNGSTDTNGANAKTSVTNPQANGHTYSGKFVTSGFRAADESVDGRAARDCNIVQELTLVKTTGSLAGLGIPDKDADRKTLNFLGFQEGEQAHIYHRYRNLDPALRATWMGIDPTELGYTIVKREFITEKDKTGTLFVVFEDNDWVKGGDASLTWGSNKINVGKTNYDNDRNLTGHGYGDANQLTGLAKTNQDTAYTDAQTSDTNNRVITNVRRSERANGEYAVTQNQKIAYEGTTEDDALVARIKSGFGSATPSLTRVWFRRTTEAKNTLVASDGVARSNDTNFEGSLYQHDNVDISDHGDGTFTVTQTLAGVDTSVSVGTTYFSDSIPEVKVFTRSKDEFVKKVYYWKYITVKATEQSAVSALSTWGADGIAGGIVPGSDHVVKKGRFVYVGVAKRIQSDLAGTPKPKIEEWAAL